MNMFATAENQINNDYKQAFTKSGTANPNYNPQVPSIAGAVASGVETGIRKTLGLPPFDDVITVIAGIILVALGIIFIGSENKTLQTIVETAAK